ncbi:unnamed protein product [Prunus armeniaca]|uniref:Uncharacterized protein n=1 Tax=Prunus armeniaca TaxID=36596 RepID=A0A6J5U4H9_PRUAR|nr:unnamed protein product [Prunus armeniaca]
MQCVEDGCCSFPFLAAGLKQKVNKLEESLKQKSVEMEEMKRAGAQDALKMQAALDTTVQKCKAMKEDILQFKKQMVKMEEKQSGKK